MSLTLATWLFIYFSGLALSLVHPLFGLCAYIFEYYLRPSLNWWGRPLPDLRWTLIAAVVLGVTFLIRRPGLRKMVPLRNPMLPFIALMLVNMLIVGTWAIDVDENWRWTTMFGKHALIYGLIIGVVRTRLAFDLVLACHVLGTTWWGWNALGMRRIAGRLEGIGSGDTIEANGVSSHILMILPIIAIFLFAERTVWKRAVAFLAAPLVINLFILANSRGSTLALGAMALLMIWFAPLRRKVQALGAVLLLFAAVFTLADQRFLERQASTANPQDSSAQSRLVTWRRGVQLVQDHPLGTGGRGFHALSPVYIPEVVERYGGEGRASHNTLLQVTAEWGVQGLMLFTGFLLSMFVVLHRVRRRAAPGDWFSSRSLGLELAQLGLLVNGMVLDSLYKESVYWLAALAFALFRIQATEQAAVSTEGADARAPTDEVRMTGTGPVPAVAHGPADVPGRASWSWAPSQKRTVPRPARPSDAAPWPLPPEQSPRREP